MTRDPFHTGTAGVAGYIILYTDDDDDDATQHPHPIPVAFMTYTKHN